MKQVLRWASYLIVSAVAILFLVAAADDTFGRRLWNGLLYLEESHGGRFILAGIGIVIAVLQGLLVARWYTVRRYAREISYQNEFGKVAVSLVAIEEALTRAIENEQGVRKVHIRVFEDRVKRTVIVQAALTLWEGNNVTATNHRCQEILRRRFTELMPEKTSVQVHLNLHRLNQRRAEDAVAAAAVPDARIDDSGEGSPRKGSSITPGLAKTQGTTSEEAAASLLQRDQGASHYSTPRREPSQPLAAIRERRRTDHGDSDTDRVEDPTQARRRTAVAERVSEDELDDSLDYNNLYAGPTYPVGDDEDESGMYPQTQRS